MTEFTIKSGNWQTTYNFDGELYAEELADIVQILSIILCEVETRDALIQMELLRQVPNFFDSIQEDNIA